MSACVVGFLDVIFPTIVQISCLGFVRVLGKLVEMVESKGKS